MYIGEFLNLYGGGYFDHRDHRTKPPLRSDMDPNVPEHLLRPFLKWINGFGTVIILQPKTHPPLLSKPLY
jgi:hypothetical protein